MVTRSRLVLAAVLVVAATCAGPHVAGADTVAGVGNTIGHRYRGGDPRLGDVYFASSVQVNRNNAGQVTKVRGAGRITKFSGARAVQVDRVALGSGTTTVAANAVPASSGAGPTVISYTGWVAVAPNTCRSYRVRTNYSVRWNDGALSKFSILSPPAQVCGPRPPQPPTQPGNPGDTKNCSDFATWAQAKAWFDRYYPYYGDVAKLDADNDRDPCETLPGR